MPGKSTLNRPSLHRRQPYDAAQRPSASRQTRSPQGPATALATTPALATAPAAAPQALVPFLPVAPRLGGVAQLHPAPYGTLHSPPPSPPRPRASRLLASPPSSPRPSDARSLPASFPALRAPLAQAAPRPHAPFGLGLWSDVIGALPAAAPTPFAAPTGLGLAFAPAAERPAVERSPSPLHLGSPTLLRSLTLREGEAATPSSALLEGNWADAPRVFGQRDA